MKPSPRQTIGPDRTAAASRAIGVTDGEFTVDGLVLDTDPLGRGADVLDIKRAGRIVGRMIHQPGLYGEIMGDWRYKIASSITLKSHEVQGKSHLWPLETWRYDAGPFDCAETALRKFAAAIHTGEMECPEAFVEHAERKCSTCGMSFDKPEQLRLANLEINRLRAELAAVTEERDHARNAIASFGGGNDFDWGVLGRIDELESEVEALRITSPSAAEQADRVKPVDEAWLVATDWQPGDGSNYPLWRGMIQCSGPSMNLWWLVNERDNGTSDVIRIPWIKPTRGQVLDLMRALWIKAK